MKWGIANRYTVANADYSRMAKYPQRRSVFAGAVKDIISETIGHHNFGDMKPGVHIKLARGSAGAVVIEALFWVRAADGLSFDRGLNAIGDALVHDRQQIRQNLMLTLQQGATFHAVIAGEPEVELHGEPWKVLLHRFEKAGENQLLMKLAETKETGVFQRHLWLRTAVGISALFLAMGFLTLAFFREYDTQLSFGPRPTIPNNNEDLRALWAESSEHQMRHEITSPQSFPSSPNPSMNPWRLGHEAQRGSTLPPLDLPEHQPYDAECMEFLLSGSSDGLRHPGEAAHVVVPRPSYQMDDEDFRHFGAVAERVQDHSSGQQ